MKFPYELSEQRLTLLSPKDLKQYLFEHSAYYSHQLKQKALLEYQKVLNLQRGYFLNEIKNSGDDYTEEEQKEMANVLAEAQLLVMFDQFADIFREFINEDVISYDDYNAAKEECVKLFQNPASLNETAGADMFAWEKGIKAIIGGTLTTAFAGIIGMAAAGKYRGAVAMLKRYMARLMEMIDTGAYKEKSIFKRILAKLHLIKKDKMAVGGDESMGCFRAILETSLKQLAASGLILLKSMGYVGKNTEIAINNIEKNTFNNGGMSIFEKKIGNQLSKLGNA